MSLDLYGRFLAAFAAVALLIVVAAWLARKLGLGGAVAPRGRNRRLAIVEILPLDARRRVVLLRRDTTEHLVLLSADGATVIESGIGSGIGADAGQPRPDFAALVSEAPQ